MIVLFKYLKVNKVRRRKWTIYRLKNNELSNELKLIKERLN